MTAFSTNLPQSFAGQIVIPEVLKSVLKEHNISSSMLNEMTLEEWREFEEFCKGIPFGERLQVRRAIAGKELANEEKLAKLEPQKEKIFFSKVKDTVGKLFHGDEGVGTVVYVSEKIAICAFHSVHVKKSATILEDSLSIDGIYGVKFVTAYPRLDIAMYKVLDREGKEREGPYLELELVSNMYEGCPVSLLSFPAFDSQTRDAEDEIPMLIDGTICRLQLDPTSDFAVGQYSSFPNSSGGVVLSKRGRLIGIHVQGLFHEDHQHYRPPTSPLLPKGPIRLPPNGGPIPELDTTLGTTTEDDEFSTEYEEAFSTPTEISDTEKLQFAIDNLPHKDSLSLFVPAFCLRPILMDEGIIGKHKQVSKKCSSKHVSKKARQK